MSSGRFPPASSDSRLSRDRSPPRAPDRRPQSSYNDNTLAARVSEPVSRSNEPHNTRREPPRGPKALVDGARGGYVPRARGGYLGRGDGRGRGDSRDRDFREIRDDPPFSRRGRGQDWASRDRFDDRLRRSSPPGRDRSRSPLSRDPRDARDGISSAGSSVLEFPVRGRGGYRGRGRGSYDLGERGRSINPEEPEAHRARSRSREREWERVARDDRELEGQRRDDPLRKEKEDRDERSRRDQPTYRPDSRNSGGAPKTPLTSRSTSATSIQPVSYERLTQGYRDHREPTEHERRPPGQESSLVGQGAYKDVESSVLSFKRSESDRHDTRNSSPPPQAPPVPAFGSIPPRALQTGQDSITKSSLSKDNSPAIHPSRLSLLDPAREAPSAPRAHILSNAPTAPKGRHSLDRDGGDSLRGQSAGTDRFPRQSLVGPPVPAGKENSFEQGSSKPKKYDSLHDPESSCPNAPSIPETSVSRSDSTQPSVRKAVEEQGRNGNIPSSLSSRPALGDASNHPSVSRIPTGPRADRTGLGNRPPVQPSIRGPANRAPPINPRGGGRQPNTLTWTNPNLNRAAPRGPSIMNTVPTKKDYAGEDKFRRGLLNFDSTESTTEPRISPQRRSFASSGQPRERLSISEHHQSQDTRMGGVAGGAVGESEVPLTVPVAGNLEDDSDDDGPEDADMDFDERDFQEAENKFKRDMSTLEARRPPTPRSNPAVLDLLEELDALASALESKIKDGSADETIKVESAALGLPSPKAEDNEEQRAKDIEHDPALSLRQRPQTPPVENLPYLASGPLTPSSFMEGLEEDPSQHVDIKKILEDRLAAQEEDLDIEYDEMRAAFIRQYKEWRMRIEDIEDAKRAQRVVEASPPPETGPATSQSTPAPGRRGRAHATELDMQKILKESEESAARDEQRRREQEDRIFEPPETFNDQREAVVPDMLNRYEAEASIFPNNNNFVPPEQALMAFAWLPKKDDFTKEEHEAFVMEYVQYPKRFGTIARSEKLAGRNYQDCVQHYYATKLKYSYKTLEANFWKSARGKKMARRRGAPNALGFGNDGQVDEARVLPLTDAGRPRRAAAPNFGAVDATDVEQSTAVTTPARRGQVGIMNGEKTSAKRAKTTNQKPGRKPKQLLAPQPGPSPGPSPQKSDAPVFRIEQRPMPSEQPQRPDSDLEGAQALAGLNGQHFPLTTIRGGEAWAPPVVAPVVHPRATSEGFTQEHMENVITHSGPEPPAVINSYWNVAETQDLKNYLAYYGQDWQAIADNIPAKTHTMVKNRFNKLVKEGDTNLEQIATRADEKIRRGEPMGPKPAPTPVSSKRRYDMTSRSDPRPLAPLAENTELERGSPSLRPKASNQSLPRPGQAPQALATLAQAEQGAAALSSQMLSQGPANPANRVDLQSHPQVSQIPQGPRLGMFQDGRPRPSPSTVISLDTPPERQPPLQHRGLQPQNQQLMERQRAMEMEAGFRQQNRAQQLLPDQKLHREREQAPVGIQNLERERQIRQLEPTTFVSSSNIQVDDASRKIINRQEEKKQLEREQREREQQQQIQQQDHQHQQQQAQQARRQQQAMTDNAGSLRHYPSNFVTSHYQNSQQSRSPASTNLQMPMSPPSQVRPNSVPAPSTTQPPPAPPQPKKKSNIMNLLNDDSEDTKPTRRIGDSRPVATPPPQQRQPPMYQNEQSIDQMLHRREAPPVDSAQHIQPHHRNQPSQPQPQQPSLSREPSRDWPTSTLHRQSLFEQRPSFQSPPAPSQPQPPSFIPSTARHSFQSLQRDHGPSPPPGHHSRTSSYSSQHKQRSSISTPAEHALRPSPYANLNPNQPSHPHHNANHHQHHQAQQQQQHQENVLQQQHHVQQQQQFARQQEQQRQRQQEDLRAREHPEVARLHHQPQPTMVKVGEYRPRSTVNEDIQARATAAMHEQERALRQQDGFRQQLDQRVEMRRVQEQQEAAARHQQELTLRRQQDQEEMRAREEAGRGRYTPFYDQQGGYAPPPQRDERNSVLPPPPPPHIGGVQGRGLGGGYEERR